MFLEEWLHSIEDERFKVVDSKQFVDIIWNDINVKDKVVVSD